MEKEKEKQKEKVVLVLGSTGKTGQHIVKQLSDKGYHIRLLVRNPETAKQLFSDRKRQQIEYVQGSLPNAIPSDILREVKWVIFTAASTPFHQQSTNSEYHVGYLGIQKMIELAKMHGQIERFLLITSLGVTRPYFFVTIILNVIGNLVMKWKLLQENELRKSGLPYLIVRPGGLNDKPGFVNRVTFVEDNESGQISRESVADVCVRALSINNLPNATFGIIEKRGKPLNDSEFDQAFAALKPEIGPIPVANHKQALVTVTVAFVLIASFSFCFFFLL